MPGDGPPSRRPGRPGRLSQNRTCAVRIRLFRTPGCHPQGRPAYDLILSQSQPELATRDNGARGMFKPTVRQ